MTNIILLSAGQGKRLSPHTDNQPKCLVSVAGKPILEWQLEAISACGLKEVSVVTGFHSELVEAFVEKQHLPLSVNCLFNPFYSIADNIGSCWAARDLIGSDTVLINGDTLFDCRILKRLINAAGSPITVTIDHKKHYDDDDMKIKAVKGRLTHIGKKLTGDIDGESIGMLRFLENGGEQFKKTIHEMLLDPVSLKLWYLSVINRMAPEGHVGVFSIDGLPWAEVDFPQDLPFAADQVKSFDWGTRVL